MTYLGQATHRLGPIQKHVLLVLSTRGASTCTDWSAWYPIREEQVRSAIDSLGRRGLVDVAGFDGRSRTFALTSAGNDAVDALCADDLIEDNEPVVASRSGVSRDGGLRQ